MDDLILRSLRGDTTPREEAQLRSWRRASRDNERRYHEIALISRLATPPASVSRDTPPPACVLIGEAERRTAAVLKAPRRRRREPVRRSALWAAATIAVLVIGAALYTWRGQSSTGQPHEVVAGPSETTTVALEDGSVVRLAPGSRLRFDPRSAREVSLDGRGFFAITRSTDRPFRVRTRAGDAVVMGTRFELSTADNELRLLVVEGHVALGAGGGRVDVRDNQSSRIVQGTVLAPELVPDAASEIDWLGNFLVFQATPVPDVARELQRVYGVPVIIADSTLVGQAITGYYSDRPFEEVFDIICRVLDARCSTEDGRALMRTR